MLTTSPKNAAVTIRKESEVTHLARLKSRSRLPRLPILSIFIWPSWGGIAVAMKVIDLPHPWKDCGLSFGEFFHRKELVGSALLKLIAALPPPIVSYCL